MIQRIITLCGMLLLSVSTVFAHNEPTHDVTPQQVASGAVQEVTGTVSSEISIVYYDLFGLTAGQTVHIYVGSTAIDPYVAIGDIDFSEVLAADDDGGDGTNSALAYEIPTDGDYSIAVADCCDDTASGEFRLVVGIDVPAVLDDAATPTGDDFVVLYGVDASGAEALAELTTPTDCSTLAERPTLSGDVQTRETANFIIHYTSQGADGATENFVDEVEQIVEEALDIQVNQLGWPLPPSDCGEGGDARFDIYLMETLGDSGTLGYATPEGTIVDNPNSDIEELYAVYSYLVIDNNFAGLPMPRPMMRATVAHEFNHNIQFGYDFGDASGWYYEATAVWMETQVFPDSQDATPYNYALFQSADMCVGSTPEDEALGLRIYAEWLLIDSIAQDHGADSIKRLWEFVALEEGMPVFYSFLDELGVTAVDTIERMAVRNLIYGYDLGAEFTDRVRVERVVNGAGDVTPRQNGVQELGVDYVWLRSQGVYTISVNQPNLNLLVVGVDQPRDQATVYELGQSGTVDTSPYSHTYILVVNTDEHSSETDCTYTDWQLSITDGTGAELSPAWDEIFEAPNFVPAG